NVTSDMLLILPTRASRKILTPSSLNKLGNILTNNQLLRKARLRPRIYHNRRAVSKMMTHNFLVCRMNVCRRLKARPRRPEKIGDSSRHARIVMQNYERPFSKDFFTRQPRSLLRIFLVRYTFDNQTAAAENFSPFEIARQFSSEFARQLAHCFAQSEQDSF